MEAMFVEIVNIRLFACTGNVYLLYAKAFYGSDKTVPIKN